MEALKKELEKKELQAKKQSQKIWGLNKDEAIQLIDLIDKVLLACMPDETRIKELQKKIKKAKESIKSLQDMGLDDLVEEVKQKIRDMNKEIEQIKAQQRQDYPDGWSLPALKKFKKNLKEKFNI